MLVSRPSSRAENLMPTDSRSWGTSMTTSKRLLAVSIPYLVAKLSFDVICYFFPAVPAAMTLYGKSEVWSALCILGYLWFLPLGVVVGTVVWAWKADEFRWTGVLLFVGWISVLTLVETTLLVLYFSGFGDLGAAG